MQRAVSLVLVFVCLLTLPALSLAALDVYFLDVGQGDASLILCDGESMLIDGGPPAASRFIYSILTRDLKLQRLDHLIATHPHSDHVGGLSAALSACQPGLVYSPVYFFNDPVFLRFRELVLQRSCSFTMPLPGQSLMLGGARVTFLAPSKLFGAMNDNSICLRLDYGTTSFLFTGDAEVPEELELLSSGLPLHADVLKVGHHGSSTSSSEEFLNAVLQSPEGGDKLLSQISLASDKFQSDLDSAKELIATVTDDENMENCGDFPDDWGPVSDLNCL